MQNSNAHWTTLSKVDTGSIFTQLYLTRDNRWPAIVRAVAEEFECDEDDLACHEDDECREFVTLNGKPIIEIHDGYISRTASQIDTARSFKAFLAARESAETFLVAHHRGDNRCEAGLEKVRKLAKHLGFELVPIASDERAAA